MCAFSLILALAISISAAAASFVVHQAASALAIGVSPYQRIGESPNAYCAAQVVHGAVSSDSSGWPRYLGYGVAGAVKFSSINVSTSPASVRVPCEGRNASGMMILLSPDELQRNANMTMAVLQIDKKALGHVSVAGVDTQPRKCGAFQPAYEAYYAFTDDIAAFVPRLQTVNIAIPDSLRRKGEKWMIKYTPKSQAICVYIDVSAASFAAGKLSGDSKRGNNSSEGEGRPYPSPESRSRSNASAKAACFPGSASVELQDGSVKVMSDVEVGDAVKVGDCTFSEVFMFTHKLEHVAFDFIALTSTSGMSISLTGGHYIYVNGELRAAERVRPGDFIEAGSGERLLVAYVRTERKMGLFNPQTIHGDIIVNRIRASTFTTAVRPSAAQALLSPVRALYGKLGLSPVTIYHGLDSIYNWA